MATHTYPIKDNYRTVTRPVTIEIVRQMMEMTGLDPSVFRSNMVGMAEQEKVPGSTIGEDTSESYNRTPTDQKFKLEVREEITGNNMTPVVVKDHLPIFYDEKLRVSLKPVYSNILSTISVVFTTRDKVVARNWLTTIQNRIYRFALTNYHTVHYSYLIPKVFIHYLLKFHQMRENVEPYNEDFGEWMKRCFTKNYDIVTTLDGQDKMFAIEETQTNIYGWFDFEFEPVEPSKDSDSAGEWQIQFDYKFYYQRPDSLTFSHPLVIHNQILPENMIAVNKPEWLDSYNTYQGLTADAFDKIVYSAQWYNYVQQEGIVDPYYDDWIASYTPPSHMQVTRILLGVDDTSRYILDLNDVSDLFVFKPSIINYMNTTMNKMFKLYDSIFHIRLYRWHDLIDYKALMVDDELKVHSTFDMSKRDMWHMVIYLVKNPAMLTQTAWHDISKHCDAFHEWIETILGSEAAGKVRCNADNTVNQEDLFNFIDDIKKQIGQEQTGTINNQFPESNIKTVGLYSIIAKRETKGRK